MRHTRLALLATVALACSTLAYADTPTAYPFVCRGPMVKTINMSYKDGMGAMQFEFKRSTRAGGVTGATVPPGSCAWRDRPVAQSESNRFYFDYNAQASESVTVNMIQECMTRADCVISVDAYTNELANKSIYSSHALGSVMRLHNTHKP